MRLVNLPETGRILAPSPRVRGWRQVLAGVNCLTHGKACKQHTSERAVKRVRSMKHNISRRKQQSHRSERSRG